MAAIVEFLGLGPGRRVLDLGAGTGKLTRLSWCRPGPRSWPWSRGRACARSSRPLVPGVEVLDGDAEAIPLPNGSVDGVVVAQAFHWFDAVRALSELHRVLAPGGGLVLDLEPARRVGAVGRRAWASILERATGGEIAGRRPRLARRAARGTRCSSRSRSSSSGTSTG